MTVMLIMNMEIDPVNCNCYWGSYNEKNKEKGDYWYNYLIGQNKVKKMIVTEKEYNNIREGKTRRYIIEGEEEDEYYIYFVKSQESEKGIYGYIAKTLLVENKGEMMRKMNSRKSILKRKKLMLSKQEINNKLSEYKDNKCSYIELGYDTYICTSSLGNFKKY